MKQPFVRGRGFWTVLPTFFFGHSTWALFFRRFVPFVRPWQPTQQQERRKQRRIQPQNNPKTTPKQPQYTSESLHNH
jgi:hypothetical protein